MGFRVDNIPAAIKPFYLVLSFLIALSLYLLCLLIKKTNTIVIEGEEKLKENKNYIFCIWHQALAGYFTVFTRHKGNHIWMNHPSWVMKPIHYWLHLSGVRELALGSSGNSGKDALQKVISHLKKGYSTLITPDGPAGPPHKIKDGVLQMSFETGLPIIPLKIIPSNFIIIPTWDKKKVPMPFGTIRIIYGNPLFVTENNMEEIKNILEKSI